jgi:hypothetical protein
LPSSYSEISNPASASSYEPDANSYPDSYSPNSYNSYSTSEGPSYSTPAYPTPSYKIAVTVSDKTSGSGFLNDATNFPKFDDFFKEMIRG